MSNLYFIKNNTFRVHQSTFQRWLTQSSMSLGSLGWSSALLRPTSSTSEIQTRPTSTLRWTSTWHCYGLPLSSPFSTWSSPSSRGPSTMRWRTTPTSWTSTVVLWPSFRSACKFLSFTTSNTRSGKQRNWWSSCFGKGILVHPNIAFLTRSMTCRLGYNFKVWPIGI